MGTADAVVLDGRSLTFADVAAVARSGAVVRLAPDARSRMQATLDWVLRAADGQLDDGHGGALPVYGVNTGYGSLARVRIEHEQISELSWNLVRSHAAGVGPEMPVAEVRAMMLLRANALAKGASGCRPELVERLCDMLNAGVTPVVPSRGSCGSSGDLAPLAHLGLVLFDGPAAEEGPGDGWAWFRGQRMTGRQAMAAAGLQALVPGPKEGLAITNGAQLTCAVAALACIDAERLVKSAEIACAASFEALRAVTRALHPDVHALRPYPGAVACADSLRRLLDGSTLVDSVPDKVQDAYSLRCAPQVLGAVRDAMTYAARQVQVELNAVTDNPVVLLDADGQNKAFSAGLFHGEPLGFAADHLKLALVELAGIAERRVYRLTTGTLNSRLPALLRAGPHLGLVIPQATAAALVAECRQLAWPNSADSIPTCEDQEDHVAMSTAAARRAAEVLGHARRVVAIELLTASHALWLRQRDEIGTPGVGAAAALAVVEEILGAPAVTGPRDLSGDIEALAEAVADGRVVDAVEARVGPLAGVLDA